MGMSTLEEKLEDVPDDELASALASLFEANELRRWMSANGLTRSRGANKLESARQAVAQDRAGVARYVYEAGAVDVDHDPKCDYHGVCGNRTAGRGAPVCDECMDAIRANDRAADPVDRADHRDGESFMAEIRAQL
jgi:hypothetical protein